MKINNKWLREMTHLCAESGSDEIPAAYKNIDQVMKYQSDLLDVVHTLEQIICVKG